jgi:hypothetical protein
MLDPQESPHRLDRAKSRHSGGFSIADIRTPEPSCLKQGMASEHAVGADPGLIMWTHIGA